MAVGSLGLFPVLCNEVQKVQWPYYGIVLPVMVTLQSGGLLTDRVT
jgi:hypothetical protein